MLSCFYDKVKQLYLQDSHSKNTVEIGGSALSILGLSYFLVAAEELNFTTAAQRLYITQQTLSNHMKRLEDEYHVQLFERHPRLCLTTSGERMVHYASRIVRLDRMMRAEFSDISKESRGILVVGCSRVRAKYFFPLIWKKYQETYPYIEIRMVEGNSSTLETSLLARKVDLCIGLHISEQLRVCQEKLMPERLYFVVSKVLFHQRFRDQSEQIFDKFQNGVDFQDVLEIPLILQPPSNHIRNIVTQSFESADMVPNPVFESNDTEMIFNMCIAGSGGIFISQSSLYPQLELLHQKLQNVYIFPVAGITLLPVIAYPADPPLPHYAQAFINVCKQVFFNTMKKAELQHIENVY